MKDLTIKDAVWCKNQKQWDKIIKLYDLEADVESCNYNNRRVIMVAKKIWDTLDRAKFRGDKIVKAKNILNDVLGRIERLEEKIVPTSIVKNELTKLPLDWCIKVTVDNYHMVAKWSQIEEMHYNIYVFHDKTWTANIILKTQEISDEQFKKWVLKTPEIEMIEPLSIREVQVKVESKEEAKECAEIVKACGEEILGTEDALEISKEYAYFRYEVGLVAAFAVFVLNESQKEISIQEYRERFGKPNKLEIPKYITQEEALEFGKKAETIEIDWSKAGQYVGSKNEIFITQKHQRNCNAVFTGVCVKKLNEDGFEVGDFSDDLIKIAFKLCAEPITLENERKK